MRVFETLRNRIFWFTDSIKGGKKKDHYNDIKFIHEHPKASKTVALKKERLQTLLKHATETTSFYKEYSKVTSIEGFPVINKNSIRDNFECFRSISYRNRHSFEVNTSGSTGTPFKIYQDTNKKLRNVADNIYFSEQAGFSIGNRLTYFRMWNAFEKKGKIARILQNLVPVDVFEMKEKKVIDEILKNLSKNKATHSWLGYASAYQYICKHIDSNASHKTTYKLASAIAISERLNTDTKERMQNYFNVDVISRYSNVENGILAQQPLGENTYFEINEASYYMEVLEMESDHKVPDGTPGRIVITDLYNYMMPMIRYDTGDIGIKDMLNGKPVFTKVNGRKIDQIYNTKGELITFNLVLLVNNYPELLQFQLIQKNKTSYLFKINCKEDGFVREQEFINEFSNYLGKNADITVEYVNEIPLLASGKRRGMINEMTTKSI